MPRLSVCENEKEATGGKKIDHTAIGVGNKRVREKKKQHIEECIPCDTRYEEGREGGGERIAWKFICCYCNEGGFGRLD